MEFINLFEPITINRVLVRNRIVMPAMALAYTNDYSFSRRFKAFYRERALGGVGLMIIGPFAIDKIGSTQFMPGIFEDRHIPSIREFIAELHKDSEARLGIQLMQMGRYASSRNTGIIPMAPSAIPSKLTGEVPREMTLADIEDVKEAFAQASRRAVNTGFDYIEILAAGGYLIGEFLSPVTNRRTDQYGGHLKNRMRFGLEVIDRVRQAAGKDFAIGIRVSGHDFLEGGHTDTESALFCAEAENSGVDCINVTGGWHETNVPQITGEVPSGAFLHLARAIKGNVKVPVFASNRLGDPVLAERALRSGAADMICWGRPLLADPELPKKVQKGTLDEIVPCITCNQGCFDSLLSGSSVCCTVNPRLGRELDIEIKKAQIKKRIIVAGGGPSGMEFALTASQRGHHVTLYEKNSYLGGQLNLAAAVPGKKDFFNLVKSFEKRMQVNGVNVNLQTALTEHDIEEKRPDVLVVASGAMPAPMNVQGIDHQHVINAWDVLSDKAPKIGSRVIIVGGSATGCETALYVGNLGVLDPETFTFLAYHSADDGDKIRGLLYKPGRRITVIDVMERFAVNMGPSTRWPLMKRLKLMGIDFRPRTKLVEITEDAVTVETEAGRESISADTVIIAVGSKSTDNLMRETKFDRSKLFAIGDAKEPRNITDAIREGFDLALRI
jgi:2,4-dienoyl-CoA reductase (NADPH2)